MSYATQVGRLVWVGRWGLNAMQNAVARLHTWLPPRDEKEEQEGREVEREREREGERERGACNEWRKRFEA